MMLVFPSVEFDLLGFYDGEPECPHEVPVSLVCTDCSREEHRMELEPLEEFDGKEVRKVLAKIVGTGDGLSDSMEFEPVLLHHGQEVSIVLRGVVTQIGYQPMKGAAEFLVRVQTIRATSGGFAENGALDDLLKDQEERIRLAKEAAAGVQRLPEGDDPLGVFGGDSKSEPSEEEKALVAEEEAPPPPPPSALTEKRAQRARKTAAAKKS
jgi:hypothetical protein